MKLSDTQLVILSAAAKHEMGLARAPKGLPAAARNAVFRSLIKNNLLTEINAQPEHVGLGWRQDEGGAPRKPRKGTKQEVVLAHLRRDEGATIAQRPSRAGDWPRRASDGDASMPYDLAKHADLVGLVAHARLSWQHWFARTRATRPGLSDDRYGGAYALDGAATWRRRLADLKAQIRAIEAGT